MKVAAYQSPLCAAGPAEALGLIRQQVARCEADGVEILCCPEAGYPSPRIPGSHVG
jgi:predicted amidohydrolase